MEKEFKTTIYETFTKRQWNNLSKEEKKSWEPVDPGPWPEPEPKESKDQAWKRIQKTQKEKNINNLRIKAGDKFNLAGSKAKVLAWGPKWHLCEMKHNSGKEGWGLLQRTSRDTSWGIQDTMDPYQAYTSYKTLPEAELAYSESNR